MKRQAKINIYDVDNIPIGVLGVIIENHQQGLKEFLRDLLSIHIRSELESYGYPVKDVYVIFEVNNGRTDYGLTGENIKTGKVNIDYEAGFILGLNGKEKSRFNMRRRQLFNEAAIELSRQLEIDLILEDIRAGRNEFLVNGDVWTKEYHELEIGA